MEITLKVAEALTRDDVGRGVARLDSSSRNKLGVAVDDVIEIVERKKNCATVWRAPHEDEGRRIIRIDSLTREKAHVSPGGKVKIRKGKANPALSITLVSAVPEDPKAKFGLGYESIIKEKLLKRVSMKGNIVIIPGWRLWADLGPSKSCKLLLEE